MFRFYWPDERLSIIILYKNADIQTDKKIRDFNPFNVAFMLFQKGKIN